MGKTQKNIECIFKKNVVLVYNKSFYQSKRIIYVDIHACT